MSRKARVWFVYILKCADDCLYTGITTDIRRRLAEHNAGRGSKALRGKRPVRVVYRESHPSRALALKREAQIKKWPRTKKLAILDGHIL